MINFIEKATNLMCINENDKILPPHQYFNKTINEVIEGMESNGYQNFIWCYPVAKNSIGFDRFNERYFLTVGIAYEAGNQNYLQFLQNSEKYMHEFLKSLNRTAEFVVKNISEFQLYPQLSQVFEKGEPLVKFPTYYAATTCYFEI
jgi:hypothetical protein